MQISRAESDVVVYLQKGYSNQQIADKLFITEKTVKFHLTNIFKKYEVKSRQELLLKLTGFYETEKEIMKQVSEQLPASADHKATTQQQKIQFIDQQFKIGQTVTHLHSMMMDVTKDSVNPATVNAACNCVARLNETINTAIQAARFLNER
jgi:DNA-binding CsgD family transcriptional regulator